MPHTRTATKREHDEAQVAVTMLTLAQITKKRKSARRTLKPPHPCPYCECPECFAVKKLLRLQSEVWPAEIE